MNVGIKNSGLAKMTNVGSGSGSNSGSSFGSSVSASSSTSTGLGLSWNWHWGWGTAIIAVLVLMVVFAVYYQTIGYYIQIGWDKLTWSRKHGEKVEIDIPGGPSAELTPATSGTPSAAPLGTGLGKILGELESDVESALGGTAGKQVFNINRNLYTFSEAEPLCRAFGAELATYDQVKDAYKSGADWCNYGWVKGQLAVYPTQKATYDKLQHGPESDRMSCGLPGVNGGYFPNEDQRFGVNCYGARPAESALDERLQQAETSDIAFDRQVNHYKSEIDSIAVTPWSSKQWSA
jgi:hypothetical protein